MRMPVNMTLQPISFLLLESSLFLIVALCDVLPRKRQLTRSTALVPDWKVTNAVESPQKPVHQRPSITPAMPFLIENTAVAFAVSMLGT